MPHYLPRPLPVFAMQYTGDNAEEIISVVAPDFHYEEEDNYFYKILCFEFGVENYRVPCGDYILRDHKGSISVMGREEFEERYEKRQTKMADAPWQGLASTAGDFGISADNIYTKGES